MTEQTTPFRTLFDADCKLANWTQADVAKGLNVKQQAVSAWRSKNMVPFRRQSDLVQLFKDKLGEESEIVRADTRMDLAQTMGAEVLEYSRRRTRAAAWDRRQEYEDSTQSQRAAISIDELIKPATIKNSKKNTITNSNLSDYMDGGSGFDFKTSAETISKHNEFLETLDHNFPGVETRRSLEHLNSVHQFDICVENKVFIVSSGCFGSNLGYVRDFPRYAMFAIKLAAWANTLEDKSFICVHGTHNVTPSELLVLERVVQHLEILNLNLVLIPSYNDYFELIGNIYSNLTR